MITDEPTEIEQQLITAATSAMSEVRTGPDYQVLYWHPETTTAWWVSADGDEEDDVRHIVQAIEQVSGVSGVKAEAEGYPPENEGWVELAPRRDELKSLIEKAEKAEQTGIPQEKFDQEMLSRADFVRLSPKVLDDGGTNCGNCLHMKDGLCQFNDVGIGGQHVDLRNLIVTPKDCCAEWDAEGVKRSWREKRKHIPWFVTKAPGPHPYSTTMLCLEDAVSDDIAAAALIGMLPQVIADEDLTESGRETNLHITTKYGLMTSNPNEVRLFVRSYGKVNVTVGKTGVFHNQDIDVVYLEISGDTLYGLSNLIGGSIPNEDAWPTYKPHITLAYVKPGTGDKYAGISDLEGLQFTFDVLTFADQAGRETKISLTDPYAPAITEFDLAEITNYLATLGMAVVPLTSQKDYHLTWENLGGNYWRDVSQQFDITPWGSGAYFVLLDRNTGMTSQHRTVADAKRQAGMLWDRGKSFSLSKGQGQPCKPGETAARSGCIPTSGESGAPRKPINNITPQTHPSGVKPILNHADHPGAKHGSRVRIRPTTDRAIGDNLKPVELKTKLGKYETGRIGEAAVMAWLRTIPETADAQALNAGKTNEFNDLFADHKSIEVKSGLASNSKSAQQWRITFSMDISAKAVEAYNAMSPKEKTVFNEKMQQEAMKRKIDGLKAISEKKGFEIKPVTITTIINPDTRVVDIFETEGYHQRIGWRNAHRVASVEYDAE